MNFDENSSSLNKELNKEFREKYIKFVENRLLHDGICEALNFAGLNRNESSSGGCVVGRGVVESVKEKFLKSFAVANLKASGGKVSEGAAGNCARDAFLAEFKPEPLNDEEKNYLIKEIEKIFDYRWRKIDRHLKLFEESTENYGLENELNSDEISRRLEIFIESAKKSKIEKEQLCEEVQFKLERCLSESVEICKLLKTMLEETRLKFYANENRLKCEHKLVECDALLFKIKSVANDLFTDLYSPEKLKALKVLRAQIDLNKQMAREKHNQITESLASYEALGKDFELILAEYTELRTDLDNRIWSYNKLKADRIIF